MSSAVAPLAALLAQLDARISSLEQKAGVAPGGAASSAPAPAAAATAGADSELSKLAEEFDGLVTKFGKAFSDVCDKIGGDAPAIVSCNQDPASCPCHVTAWFHGCPGFHRIQALDLGSFYHRHGWQVEEVG